MQIHLKRLLFFAECNVAESRQIVEAQRALVEKLRREDRSTSTAQAMLRVAQATQIMFEAHRDQLQRLVLEEQGGPRPAAKPPLSASVLA